MVLTLLPFRCSLTIPFTVIRGLPSFNVLRNLSLLTLSNSTSLSILFNYL